MSQIVERWDECRNYLAGNGRLNLRTYNFRVSTAKTQVFVPAARLGELLRQWRSNRRMSQLDLALEADISSRHLSYVESGKAQPSRDMVTRLRTHSLFLCAS